MANKNIHYIVRLFGSVLETYLVFIVVFLISKPVFMLYNHAVYHDAVLKDFAEVIWHGLPMDMSVAGYLTVIPALVIVSSVWLNVNIIRIIQRIYFAFIAALMSLIFIVDVVLYGYWGFRLDTTPLFYFMSSPRNAVASVSIWFVFIGLLLFILLSLGLYKIFERLLSKSYDCSLPITKRIFATFVSMLYVAVLFLPIRGSITTSTMNIGRVYYSSNQRMNHAAINPCFSLLSSYVNGIDTKKQYRFMSNAEADKLFALMRDTTARKAGDGVPKILRTTRPNIILVVLESFSCKIMASMGGEKNVAINMDKFADEGVLFTNFYANSFRTDRGLASIIAAYPAQPTMSIMKYSEKTESLPMFPKELQRAGYDLSYYYGGDADFTNMRSFLVTAGFNNIVSDKNFDLKLRLSKWGVHDQYIFDKALQDIRIHKKKPFLKIIQTSSSHEPFEVPFKRHKNKVLNAFAYADDCLGKFVNELRKTKQWDNTLVILVPDHLGCFPENSDCYSFEHYHIPLIMIGGAVKSPLKITEYGSQTDIAATLFSQLGMPYDKFVFSKDMLNPNVPHFGFSTVPNAFAMVSPDDSVFFNCDTHTVITDKGRMQGLNLPFAKAYLQKLYDDISKR